MQQSRHVDRLEVRLIHAFNFDTGSFSFQYRDYLIDIALILATPNRSSARLCCTGRRVSRPRPRPAGGAFWLCAGPTSFAASSRAFTAT
jgi:hypothetical protein